jgi:hypothetical protein
VAVNGVGDLIVMRLTPVAPVERGNRRNARVREWECSMIAQIVRYKSGLSHEEVGGRFDERADRYRQVTGLVQRYYVYFPTPMST